MENAKVLNALDEFAKLKPKSIPAELEEYLRHVASTGDPVYQWSLVKCFFRQKMINVISEFYESCPMMDVPISPNVDPFNYETMKMRLLERFDTFSGAPYTIQRISELLTAPRKQYNHVDKFMRAIEKNIWVVTTREPGRRDSTVSETVVNGVLANITHTINIKPCPERLQRQSELFDDDDEDEEPTVEIPSLEPLLSSEEDEPPATDHNADTLPSSEHKDVEEESLELTVQENVVDESTCPQQEQELPLEEPIAKQADESPEPELDEAVVETHKEEEPTVDYKQNIQEKITNEPNEKTQEQDIEVASPVTEEPLDEAEGNAEESSDQVVEEVKEVVTIVVTEVTEAEEEETKELVEDVTSAEPEIQPILEEPSEDTKESILPSPGKRKFDETNSDDLSEDVPNKRLETDDLKPAEVTEASEPIQELTTPDEASSPVELPVEKLKPEIITEIVEVTGSVEEESGEMESSEMEEKLEMVVEENEAMEVDEIEGEIQSPMAAEDDSTEPMEQSDVINS